VTAYDVSTETVGLESGLGGAFDGTVHSFLVRVYLEDTDFSGVVYHGSYVRWFERGRTEFLRAQGINLSDMAASAAGETYVVRRMEVDYRAPGRMDDVVRIETRTRDVTGASAWMEQRALREDRVLAQARVQVVAIDLATGRPVRIKSALAYAGDGSRPPKKNLD